MAESVGKSRPRGPEILLSDDRDNMAGSSWTEYLCMECTPEGVILSGCTYDMLAKAEQYVVGYADGVPEYRLPEEINGKKVVGIQDDRVIGGDLRDWSGENTFLIDARDFEPGECEPCELARAWLREHGWEQALGFDDAWKQIIAAFKSLRGASTSNAASDSIRDCIARDFGVVLAIGEGDGTPECPIPLLETNPKDALMTALRLVHFVSRGMGRLYRIVTIAWSDSPATGGLLEIGIQASDSGNVSGDLHMIRYLFDVRAVRIQPPTRWPSWNIRDVSGIEVPHQFGWLHLLSKQDFQENRGGMGRSFTYGGFGGVKGTFYIYDRGAPVEGTDIKTERVGREFKECVRDVELQCQTENARYKSSPQSQLTWTDGRAIAYLAMWALSEREQISVLALGVKQNMFLKARLTFARDYPECCLRDYYDDLTRFLALRPAA